MMQEVVQTPLPPPLKLYVGPRRSSCVEYGQNETTMSLYGGRELILNCVLSEFVLTLRTSEFFNKELS